MPIINNYNYYGGSDTESVSWQTSNEWIENCRNSGRIDLTPSSADCIDDNRVIIRAGGKVYLIEIDPTGFCELNDINQPSFKINNVAGIVLESTFIDYVRSNIGSNGNYFRCSTLNSNNYKHHLDTFWNSNV